MWPAASVSGLYFAHPEARYFAVDMITRDQVQDYAKRPDVRRSSNPRPANPLLRGGISKIRQAIVIVGFNRRQKDILREMRDPEIRKDNVLTSDTRVKYLVNRFAAVSAYYRYTKRDSDVPVYNFDKHLVGMNVTAQF